MQKKLSLALIPIGTIIASIPNYSFAAACFTSVFNKTTCSYNEWIQQVWGWAMGVAFALSVFMLVAAGILWSTSGGNPDKIGVARKMILGVLSGVALLVLARVFLNFLGLGGLWIF